MYGAFGMARVEDANGDNGRLIDGHWSRPSSVEIRIYPDAWPPTSCQALLTSREVKPRDTPAVATPVSG